MSLPPCPHEGCTSDSDHHWHDKSPEPLACLSSFLCQDVEPKYRCYSRPLRDTGATPLMLSLPTVAKLVEAARAEGYAAHSAQPEPVKYSIQVPLTNVGCTMTFRCEGMDQECAQAAAWRAKLPCGHGAPFCDSCRRRCDWIIERGGLIQCRSDACPWSALIEWSRL